MSPIYWQTLRASIETIRANAERFAQASTNPIAQVGYHAQVEVLDIILNEMITIELDEKLAAS